MAITILGDFIRTNFSFPVSVIHINHKYVYSVIYYKVD